MMIYSCAFESRTDVVTHVEISIMRKKKKSLTTVIVKKWGENRLMGVEKY